MQLALCSRGSRVVRAEPLRSLRSRLRPFRSRIALGQAEDVIADVKAEKEPDLEAIAALAEYTLGKTDAALTTVERLASSEA